MSVLLAPNPPKPPALPRTVTAELRALAAEGRLDLPLPSGGDTLGRWTALRSPVPRDAGTDFATTPALESSRARG